MYELIAPAFNLTDVVAMILDRLDKRLGFRRRSHNQKRAGKRCDEPWSHAASPALSFFA